MLAPRDPNLFNDNMEKQDALQTPVSPSMPAKPRSHRAAGLPARSKAKADWSAASGIVDQMLAYSDWWNLPARAGKTGRGIPNAKRG
jgi:hypothetical protein